MNKSVGIKDVAAAAGMSVTTVSQSLTMLPTPGWGPKPGNGSRKLPSGSGTGPNRLAQALRTQRSGMIGFISEEIATTPHAGRIILWFRRNRRAPAGTAS